MKCDIIIPVWNQLEATRECVENIIKKTGYPYRLILVDNGSEPETKAYLESLKNTGSPEVVLIRNEKNLGYVKAVNQGLKVSNAPYICLMNNDTIPGIGWLERLTKFADEHAQIGLMNPLCDGHGDMLIDEYAMKVAGNNGRYMEMNQCFGFCTLIKREVVDKIGHLDEIFEMGGYDDTDYSMRAHKVGYRCASVHSSYVYHKQHVSFKAMGAKDSFTIKGQEAYLKKWPRHLRVGISFYINKDTKDSIIENMLKAVLCLAREWCWVNLWIFGDAKDNKEKISKVSAKLDLPVHQNIKFNFLENSFGDIQSLIRLIERSFGTKKRKKYDLIFVDNKKSESFLKMFSCVHKTGIYLVSPENDISTGVELLIAAARSAADGK